MKWVLHGLAMVISVSLFHGAVWADLPEPKEPPQNPNAAAGRKAVEAKDYKAALEHLTKAVKEVPNDADVHNMLGYSYRKTGNFEKALEHYRIALKLDRNHRSAHEYLGELYLDMNQLENAEKQLADLKRACPFFGRCPEYEDLKQAIEKYKAAKK
ncbi:MAG TPA: tetratricopeptide repeat protein [Candidatus Eisenbacteria bacterium]|nr:tetratricopeptide repeat protein [Candidatus Eisenbacteria bacterium]